MKNSLTPILEQIKNEITVDSDGKGKATIRATVRLAGVNDMSVSKALKSADLSPSKLAEHLIEQGFKGADLMTWKTQGIPDTVVASIAHYYGYEAGRHCTEQAKLVCRAFTAIGIRAWMQQLTGWTNQPKQPSDIPTPQEISELYDLTLGKAGLDPQLIAGVKLNAIGAIHPQLAQATEQAKPALQIPTGEELLSPTQLAQILKERTSFNWTARAVNKALIQQGYQRPHPEGSNNPAYIPTEEGKEFSKIILNTAKGHNKTIQSLRWFPGIVKHLAVGN